MRILGIDFSAMFRRNYEAAGGKGAGEAHDRTLQTIAAIRDGYDRVAILCDGGTSFRKALLPTYKADRERPPAPFYEQQDRCLARLAKEGCTVFPAPVVWPAGGDSGLPQDYFAEADDLCWALAEWCSQEGHALDIYGGDKDLLQCISDHACVRVIRPDHEGAWDEARVLAYDKVGVSPDLVADWLALGGDGSDGFQMFPKWTSDDGKMHPGIGPGTAAKLLGKFGTILDVVAAIEAKDANGEDLIKGAVKEALRRGKPTPLEAAELGMRLARLAESGVMVDFDVLTAEPVYLPLTDAKKVAVPKPVEPIGAPQAAPKGREEPIVEGDGDRHASPPPPPMVARVEPPEVQGEPVPHITSVALARSKAPALDLWALQPRSVDEMMRTAQWFFESRMFGKFPNEYAIFVVMMEARERGIPVGLALRNAYVVNGKAAWYASFLGALILASGKARQFRIVETTPAHAVLEYQRTEEPEPSRFVFTIEEARTAGWIKADGKWETNPRTMLRWAAIREGGRAFFMDVVAGMRTPDEIRGYATDDDLREDA